MLISLYKIPFKTRRWYIGIFTQLLEICLNNAWLMYRKNLEGKGKPLKGFRHEVYQCLIKRGRSQDVEKTGNSKIQKPRLARPVSPIRYDNVGHFISTKDDIGRCMHCHSKTSVYCIKCNVRLCFITGKSPRNCFLNFHQK
ncbi:unnamed protein product [Euphydryas editha]|uniref:PiggyBac transposable element-derived protein domain-containing protein n=1 Tax=Euphydryas editha TaxID=104508 RepID=A0AAU9TP86_EUPED|nr:unnamed protein product [Euphydryas editha]